MNGLKNMKNVNHDSGVRNQESGVRIPGSVDFTPWRVLLQTYLPIITNWTIKFQCRIKSGIQFRISIFNHASTSSATRMMVRSNQQLTFICYICFK